MSRSCDLDDGERAGDPVLRQRADAMLNRPSPTPPSEGVLDPGAAPGLVRRAARRGRPRRGRGRSRRGPGRGRPSLAMNPRRPASWPRSRPSPARRRPSDRPRARCTARGSRPRRRRPPARNREGSVVGSGIGSPIATASTDASRGSPTTSTPIATPSTGARRLGPATAEVAGAPGDGRGESEHDDGRARAQAGQPWAAPPRARPPSARSSISVGPVSGTTASADRVIAVRGRQVDHLEVAGDRRGAAPGRGAPGRRRA